MNGRLPVLMTASVSTRGMRGACFSDAEREQMYLKALSFYLEALPIDQPIVFAENSGWDLVGFRDKVRRRCEAEGARRRCKAEAENGGLSLFPDTNKNEPPLSACASDLGTHSSACASDLGLISRIEFISIDPSICDQTRGKGYNEILLINQAIEKSAAIRAAGAFMKVTGRYPIYNLPRFLGEAESFLSAGGQFYGDMKDHKVFDFLFPHHTDKWNGHAAYTVLFASTVAFYQEKLSQSYVHCNDSLNQWIEVVWHRLLIPYRQRRTFNLQPSTFNPVHLRFPAEPICGGLQGSVGETLVFSQSNASVKAKLARLVGNTIRRLMPWFWF